MIETRSLDAAAVLIDDRADVVQLARGRRRALQPVGRVLRECRRDDEQRDGGGPDAAAQPGGPLRAGPGGYRRASGSLAATARKYGPMPWIALVGEYSWCTSTYSLSTAGRASAARTPTACRGAGDRRDRRRHRRQRDPADDAHRRHRRRQRQCDSVRCGRSPRRCQHRRLGREQLDESPANRVRATPTPRTASPIT